MRDGLNAERELIQYYLGVYQRNETDAPTPPKSARYERSAEHLGTDLFDLLCHVFADRLEEIDDRLKAFTSITDLESDLETQIRRALDRMRKQTDRGPESASPRLEQADTKGYAPVTLGDARSSILFRTYDAMLESAIEKVQRDDDNQQTFYRVLARLYVLKKWTYEDLASLVFGPDQSAEDLARNGERIRKWIKPAVHDLREKKKQRGSRGSGSRGDPPNENTEIF
jgi:hypothetical protein